MLTESQNDVLDSVKRAFDAQQMETARAWLYVPENDARALHIWNELTEWAVDNGFYLGGNKPK